MLFSSTIFVFSCHICLWYVANKSATPPHGGKLVDQMLKTEEEKTAMRECDFELDLNERQLCDVELLMQGGFSPQWVREEDLQFCCQ